jgi:hypothetical protein
MRPCRIRRLADARKTRTPRRDLLSVADSSHHHRTFHHRPMSQHYRHIPDTPYDTSRAADVSTRLDAGLDRIARRGKLRDDRTNIVAAVFW